VLIATLTLAMRNAINGLLARLLEINHSFSESSKFDDQDGI
jgi:hypothetical protein